ncbi:L-allo-threonine aldolase [Phlebotomus argentipes]|uniref:L-allo-threonine aldolase n=1 Tax=Phlebotomus argentipes TaxID=94469 RepID=UPI00289321BD|nr:L-allo-threonine aldolase [Phlebotomus argentipes]
MYSTPKKQTGDDYHVVDLRSDTFTTPTPEMLRAMVVAKVGDDVYGEDPTLIELEQRTARELGKEAALFTISGTMGNLLAIMAHCSGRGEEVICGNMSHAFLYEQGSAAHLAGVQLATLPNLPDGTFSLDLLRKSIRSVDDHEPTTRLVIIENTHNLCGGRVIPLEWIRQVRSICTENNILMHMDGARIYNAAAYLKIPVSEIAKDFDSVTFCLSKGLSCPVGALLVGKKDFITRARRLRKALGGGLRQGGILAAAGIVSLDSVVPILDGDHRRTRRIAEAIDALQSPNFKVDVKNVQTNILMLQLVDVNIKAPDLVKRLQEVTEEEIAANVTDKSGKGIVVKISSRDWGYCRLVVYIQITDEDVELAIKKFSFVIREFEKNNRAQ